MRATPKEQNFDCPVCHGNHYVRLPYTLPEPVLDQAVDRLAKAAKALGRRPKPATAIRGRLLPVY